MLLGVFLPLYNFLVLALFGRHLGKMGVVYHTIFCYISLLACNCYNLINVVFGNTVFFFNLGS